VRLQKLIGNASVLSRLKTKQPIANKPTGNLEKDNNMTSKKDSAAAQQPAKMDLAALYRPLGLKAVLAAHVVLKSQPMKKKTA
jgi:hypothetical protein